MSRAGSGPAAAVARACAASIPAALLCGALPGAALAAPATADSYIGIILGSAHVGHGHLNDVNPGVTFGRIWPLRNPRLAWFAEAGVFRNSYRETSPLALIGLRYDLGSLGPAEFYLGAAAGLGYYRELSRSLKDDYGIPNVAGYIPLATLSLTAQVGQVEYRLTTVPAGRDVKAIFNLSVAIHF